MDGSHSPFGFIWQVATATGWSVDYILWGLPYASLQLMLADSPRMVEEKGDAPHRTPGSNARQAVDIIAQLKAHEQQQKK